MSNQPAPASAKIDYKFWLLVIFILINSYLIATGHQQVSADVLRVYAAEATRCQQVVR